MKRILYFTAGEQATSGELADIATLNALAEKPYEVRVLNALQSPNYGAGPITGDFLAGTIPAAYKDDQEDPIYPVFDPASPPAPPRDRKSTRLNSSHVKISYAVFCLKKKR